jgi:hypothetical protein
MRNLQRTNPKKTGSNIPKEGVARKCGSCGQPKFGCNYDEKSQQWICLTCEDMIQNRVTELLRFAPLVDKVENNSIVLDENELKGLRAERRQRRNICQ